MKWKKFGAFLCVLGLVLLLPGPEPVRTAGAPAEVTLSGPPLVALTFDDGPRSSTTGPLLDGLALREVPATFFLVGNRIPGNEDLVRRMAAEGHAEWPGPRHDVRRGKSGTNEIAPDSRYL